MDGLEIVGYIFISYLFGVLTMVGVAILDNKTYYKRTKRNIDAMLAEINRLQNKLIEQNARTFYLKLN